MKRPLSLLLLLAFAIFSFLFESIGAAPGLVAYWSFDSTSGNTYYDVTGHGYNALSTGTGLSFVAGIKSQALNFSGNNFQVAVQNSSENFNLNKFSIETWYYSNVDPATGITNGSHIFNFQYIASGIRNGYSLYINPNGLADFGIASSDGSYYTAIFSQTVFKQHTWYHIAATYDSINMKVYVNGLLEGSATRPGGYPAPHANAHIGELTLMDGTISYQLNAKLDELKFYNYALPADTISAHYHVIYQAPVVISYTPNPTYNQLPVLRWHLDTSVSVYRIQIDTIKSFPSPIISVPTSDTFFTPLVNLPYDTYYWRVGNDANNSNWSTISSLIIQDSLVPILIPYFPDPTINRKPVLTWHHVNSVVSYNIQISTVPTFSMNYISTAVSDTFYSPQANLPIGPIYWHVSSNLNNNYSVPDTFTILNDSIPVLIPVVPDTQYNLKPQFKWHSAVGSSTYIIQIDTVGNFLNPFTILPLNDTSYVPTMNLPIGRIFWRVGVEINSLRYSSIDTFWTNKITGVSPDLIGTNLQSGPLSISILRQGIAITNFMSNPGTFSLSIYSLTGRCIASLGEKYETPGNHTVIWNGTDKAGKTVPVGNYIAVCRIHDQTIAKRIMLIR